MIEIDSLTKTYGKLVALDSVSASIEPGKVTAVLGPNGAGKTTLIKCILGLVKPDSGSIVLNGVNIREGSLYRQMTGYMPQMARYPENLTVTEIVDMITDIRTSNPPSGKQDTSKHLKGDHDLWNQFGLEREKKKPFRALSGGNRQKLSAFLAFLFRPEVLFLDEPGAGLDPISGSTLKDKIIGAKNQGVTVILTSHILSEVQELCDQVLYLLDGNITFVQRLEELLSETNQISLERAIAYKLNQKTGSVVGGVS